MWIEISNQDNCTLFLNSIWRISTSVHRVPSYWCVFDTMSPKNLASTRILTIVSDRTAYSFVWSKCSIWSCIASARTFNTSYVESFSSSSSLMSVVLSCSTNAALCSAHVRNSLKNACCPGNVKSVLKLLGAWRRCCSLDNRLGSALDSTSCKSGSAS